jgi:muramoyltetrapeptide carboxypeptidase LdcA involved in peptidoglycan recycling
MVQSPECVPVVFPPVSGPRGQYGMMATMPPSSTYPGKPRRGDAIAVLSPSAGLPARFPLPYELGLTRLREEFGLRPVEYPTTRAPRAAPAERATDIHAAFADPDIKAVIASIGGEDELKVLAHLDPAVLAANPKPFFGYSDNTNLHLFLWNLGLVSYLGGSVMVQFGWPVALHPVSRRSLERAMFTSGGCSACRGRRRPSWPARTRTEAGGSGPTTSGGPALETVVAPLVSVAPLASDAEPVLVWDHVRDRVAAGWSGCRLERLRAGSWRR